jgi:Spy/CpxP family protein refolding chaperone
MLKWMMVAGALGLAAIDTGAERAAAQSPSVVAEACAQMADTPLGKHVIGTIGRLLVLRSELDVTAEQRERIRATVLEHRPEIAEVAQGMLKKWAALGDTVLAEEIDEKAIRAAAAEFGETLGDAAIARAKMIREVRGEFSRGQIDALKAFRAEQLRSVERLLEQVAAKR